jgi:hypothetical protein
MSKPIKVETEAAGALKGALETAGWLDGEVLAAGQLRQGKPPSTLGMVTGAALVGVLRPRRSKQLPRHFVLAVTADRVFAFKASGGRPEHGPYTCTVRPGVEGSWDRSTVRITDLEQGAGSTGGTLIVDGESIPIGRPNLNGEPNTDELLATLAG